MKKIFFLLFLTPLISQELMINSFNNNLDYDENYWGLIIDRLLYLAILQKNSKSAAIL